MKKRGMMLLVLFIIVLNMNLVFGECYYAIRPTYTKCFNANYDMKAIDSDFNQVGTKYICQTGSDGNGQCLKTYSVTNIADWWCCNYKSGADVAGVIAHKSQKSGYTNGGYNCYQNRYITPDGNCITTPSCENGQITTSCVCGTTKSGGYCYAGTYYDTQQLCQNSVIITNTACDCEGQTRISGICYGDGTRWVASLCSDGQKITTTPCGCEGDKRTDGYCVNGKHSSNIPEYSTTTLIITTIISILIIGFFLRKIKRNKY